MNLENLVATGTLAILGTIVGILIGLLIIVVSSGEKYNGY